MCTEELSFPPSCKPLVHDVNGSWQVDALLQLVVLDPPNTHELRVQMFRSDKKLDGGLEKRSDPFVLECLPFDSVLHSVAMECTGTYEYLHNGGRGSWFKGKSTTKKVQLRVQDSFTQEGLLFRIRHGKATRQLKHDWVGMKRVN